MLVHDKLSALVSEWDTPGVLYGKSVRDCTEKQIVREVWEQMKRAVNEPGQSPRLTDDMLVSWSFDPGMKRQRGRWAQGYRLVKAIKGTEEYRPDIVTEFPNLILSGDYCAGEWEVANMEAASFNARRGANAILERAGSREAPAATIPPYRPPEWEPFKRIDEDRWRRGQPNLFDSEMSPARLQERLCSGG